MIRFNCIVQAGVIPQRLWPELEAELARIGTSVLGGAPREVEVTFTVIPHGFGFRGGEISTTSVVRGTVPAGCAQDVRVDLMRQICDRWCALTGCSTDELVVSARDMR